MTTITAGTTTPPPSGRSPLINLAPRDVEALAAELVAYHAEFAPLFQRSEQRHWALAYLHGQLLELERKSIEPMALALWGGDVQAMQQFISLGAWDDAAVLKTHQRLVAETLGDSASGVLILDGCDFPKPGSHSVGVARQWCGPLGKIANCQASVVACYASDHGYTLLDRRLYLPKLWFTDAYRSRWEQCGIPDQTSFHTRPDLAREMLASLLARQVLPFQWVTCDEAVGNNPAFLDQIAALDRYYLAEVPHDTRLWKQRPPTALPPRGKRGPAATRERLTVEAPAPMRVEVLAAQVPTGEWQRYTIKEGAKGPIVAEFAFMRIVPVRDELPGPDSWLVLRRSLEETPELKTYLSNAPASTPPSKLVWASGMRWPIASAILESKSECGMDQYEVRGWVGWHHHLTMTLLAHHFLVRQRRRLGKKSAGVDGATGAAALTGGAASHRTGRLNSNWAHWLHPEAKLRGLSLAPAPNQAPA